MSIDLAAVTAAAVDRLNDGDVDGYMDALYAADVRFHGYPPQYAPDRDGVTRFYRDMVEAVPDLQVTFDDVLAQGDQLVVRFTFAGTHRGEMLEIPGTGRTFSVGGMTWLKFVDGLVVERWLQRDDLGLLVQLGALPAPATA
jgi:steroid delta-isomerase-like uncharacterized protein